MITIFTSFNKKYASRAFVLAESIRRSCSGPLKIVALVVDRLNPREERLFKQFFDEVLIAETLVPFAREVLASHTVVEACTLFKPFAMSALLKEPCSHVIYMDPDTFVTGDLTAYVTNNASDFSVHLTPHVVMPTKGVFRHASESAALKHGVFNLGYVCVRNDDVGLNFSTWWGQRILLNCEESLERGFFTDQKIIDLVPAVFENVFVDRNPALNVAPWNMHERRICVQHDGVKVNDEDAIFFHFSKIDRAGAGEIVRACSDAGGALEMALLYKCLLTRNDEVCDRAGLRKTWHYDVDKAGKDISAEMRRENRQRFNLDSFLVLKDGYFSLSETGR